MANNWPREICLTPFELQLNLAHMPTFGNPTNLGDGFVAVAGDTPIRRAVSIEEFEADMRACRASPSPSITRAKGMNQPAHHPQGSDGPPPAPLKTPQEAAAYLRMSLAQLQAFIHDGAVKFISIGRGKKRLRMRFAQFDLDAFIAERTLHNGAISPLEQPASPQDCNVIQFNQPARPDDIARLIRLSKRHPEPTTRQVSAAVQGMQRGWPLTKEEIKLLPRSRPKKSFVYFIKCGPFVKIGVARNPRKRLSGLQVAQTEKLELIATTTGGEAREAALHKRFAKYHVRGEWFRFERRLAEYITDLRERSAQEASL